MNNPVKIRKYVEGILQTCRLAVLATEANGQPHASLIAITPVQGFRQMIFATYRNTRKFDNITHNGRVAVLIQGEDLDSSNQQKGFALTAFGHTQELGVSELEEAVHAHLERHPDLESFLHSRDFAIIRIKVDTYQVVRGIDDVIWWPLDY
jgi:nitroimidazol reductase NimA-like FMN-containing flavoprotein (pyridoxamine 5'-phosphate oxidase superfamily)